MKCQYTRKKAIPKYHFCPAYFFLRLLSLLFWIGTQAHAELSEKNENRIISALVKEKKSHAVGLYQRKGNDFLLIKEIKSVPGLQLTRQITILDVVQNDDSAWSKLPSRVTTQYLLFEPRLNDSIIVKRCFYPIEGEKLILRFDQQNEKLTVVISLRSLFSVLEK